MTGTENTWVVKIKFLYSRSPQSKVRQKKIDTNSFVELCTHYVLVYLLWEDYYLSNYM